jgi:hypothetical protein
MRMKMRTKDDKVTLVRMSEEYDDNEEDIDEDHEEDDREDA